ncbi:MAG: hypothetical protein AAFQ68_28760, partial [Bacteroidota bacterium]
MGIERFGRKREAIWRLVSEELNATFVPKQGFRDSHKIVAHHDHWTIIIDTYKRGKAPRVTHIRAPYIN